LPKKISTKIILPKKIRNVDFSIQLKTVLDACYDHCITMERIKILENYIHHNFGIEVTLNVTTTMVSSNIKAMEGCDKLSKSIYRDTQKSTKAKNPTTVFYHEVSKL
jgi:hypothetical protein